VVCEGAVVGSGSIGVHGGLIGVMEVSSMVGGIVHCTAVKVAVLAWAEAQCVPLMTPMVEGTEGIDVYLSKVQCLLRGGRQRLSLKGAVSVARRR
jgi:hypothetical protein